MNEKLIERMKATMAEKQISQAELSKLTGIRASSISDYLNNRYEPKQDKIYLIADALRVNPAWLSGRDDTPTKPATPSLQGIKNIVPIERRMVPVIGTIAAGTPILAEEHIEAWVPCDARCRVDFGLRVQGDSMVDAGIEDGDIVFIQQVDDVDDGQMAAVCIDDTATLKYVYKEKDGVTLNPANPRYRPMHFDASNCDNIRVVGRAVAKFSWLD